jgi:hypothetical protein
MPAIYLDSTLTRVAVQDDAVILSHTIAASHSNSSAPPNTIVKRHREKVVPEIF